MKTHFVKDGNAFYEIDEECLKQKRKQNVPQIRTEQKQTAPEKFTEKSLKTRT